MILVLLSKKIRFKFPKYALFMEGSWMQNFVVLRFWCKSFLVFHVHQKLRIQNRLVLLNSPFVLSWEAEVMSKCANNILLNGYTSRAAINKGHPQKTEMFNQACIDLEETLVLWFEFQELRSCTMHFDCLGQGCCKSLLKWGKYVDWLGVLTSVDVQDCKSRTTSGRNLTVYYLRRTFLLRCRLRSRLILFSAEIR